MISDPEVILCNNTKMLRERLSLSGERLGGEQQELEEDYVYDLYYQETVTPGWIQDILSVRAYADEGELVCVDGWWTERWMNAYHQSELVKMWELHPNIFRGWMLLASVLWMDELLFLGFV